MLATSLTVLFAALAAASPVHKRQQESSTIVVPVTQESATTVVPVVPVTSVAPVSAISSAASAASSAASSAVLGGGESASASASASASGTETYSAYPCPDGYLLTYVNVQQTYDYPAQTLLSYTADWQNATYMGYINGTGGNMVGATRFIGGDMPKEEVLSEYFVLMQNVDLQIVMNLTSGPIMTPNNAMISNYSTTLQVYNNATASTANMGATTVKLFCNFCADSQELGSAAVSNNLMGALDNLATLASGGSLDTMMPSAAASSAMSSAMPSAMPSSSMNPGMSITSDAPLAVSSIVSEVVPSLPLTNVLSSATMRA